jgi:hypothetical protein
MGDRLASRRRYARRTGDVILTLVLGLLWLVTGVWRAVPRHNDDNCWDCLHGYRCDQTAIVL